MVLEPHSSTSTTDAISRSSGDLFDVPAQFEERLHPRFRMLRHRSDLAPARCLICELHAIALGGVQPGYAVDFQAGDFDRALFWLFLFALFDAAGHRIDIRQRAPAFILTKAGTTAAIDTLTIGAPQSGVDPPADASLPASAKQKSDWLGSGLVRKLQSHKWRLPQAAGHPFVVAIQDFDNAEMPRGAPPAALLHFLFGDADRSQALGEPFPHGFFGKQEAEHVSAVLFCNDATIAKFNRLGQERHSLDTARMLRHGFCLTDKGAACAATGYVYEVGRKGVCKEAWNEGTVLIHNPHAVQPLPAGWLGASAEIEFRNGQIAERFTTGFHPVSSHTEMFGAGTPAWWIEKRMALLEKESVAHRAKPASG